MKWTFFPIAQLERLASTLDAINRHAGELPFLDSRFMLPLCASFGDASLLIALCEGSDGPLAMSVLSRNGTGAWESFQPSQSPLGAWVMRSDQAFEPLLSTLARSLPGAVLVLGVTQQDPGCYPRPAE